MFLLAFNTKKMSILDFARDDLRFVISNLSDFSTNVTFFKDTFSANVSGLYSKHHTTYNDIGKPVSSLKNTINVSEKDLVDAGIEVRNMNGFVSLKGNYNIRFIDSTGVLRNFSIQNTFPDETLGCIVIVLGHLIITT